MMYKENFIVVVKCDGKILREKGSVVCMPFGSEYSILLKNNDSRKAVVSIEIDGINVLNNNKLIVDGNSSQEVKGFMKNMQETNRFKFINKTKEIQDYRGDKIEDGFIRVSYQFEAVKQEPNIVYTYDITWNPAEQWKTGWYSSDNSCSIPRNLKSSNITGGASNTYSCSFCSFDSGPAPDEGITVKGKKENVPYAYGSTDRLENTIHVIVLKLKGITSNPGYINKPLTVSTKVTCTTCGRKNKSNNNFCYNCGTFLN